MYGRPRLHLPPVRSLRFDVVDQSVAHSGEDDGVQDAYSHHDDATHLQRPKVGPDDHTNEHDDHGDHQHDGEDAKEAHRCHSMSVLFWFQIENTERLLIANIGNGRHSSGGTHADGKYEAKGGADRGRRVPDAAAADSVATNFTHDDADSKMSRIG